MVPSGEREYWIDYARGLAALAVEIFHANEVRDDIGLYSSVVHYGRLGVPVFFFLSGYCIQVSMETSRSAQAFLLRRLLRIYLPYWASLLVVLAVIAIRLVHTGTNDIAVLGSWRDLRTTDAATS